MNSVHEEITKYGHDRVSSKHLLSMFLNRNAAEKSEKLIDHYGTLLSICRTPVDELRAFGLTVAEAMRITTIPKLMSRMTEGDVNILTSPRRAIEYLLPRWAEHSEEVFGLIALNSKGCVIAERILSRGTATCTVISPREFFRAALECRATSVLAWHNHPSGAPQPSREDVALTRRLRSAGETIGIPLADHIIIGDSVGHSFRAAESWDNDGTR